MSEEVGDDPSAGIGTTCQRGTNPAVLNPVGIADSTAYNVGQGAPTSTIEYDWWLQLSIYQQEKDFFLFIFRELLGDI